MRATKLLLITMSALLVSAGALPAQAPDPKLSFDREVFSYSGEGRKDPFAPLVGTDAIGPLFEDLSLHGILYSTDSSLSVVLVYDGAKKPYRLHVGDVIGNARVASVTKTQVRFLVQSYGQIREEVMKLAPRKTLAELQTQDSTPRPGPPAINRDTVNNALKARSNTVRNNTRNNN